jgi:hypothetical protein
MSSTPTADPTPILLSPAPEPDRDEGDGAATTPLPRFGRLRWWYEDSPIAFASGTTMGLVILAILFILYLFGTMVRREAPVPGVAIQLVAPDQGTALQPPDQEPGVTIKEMASSPKKAEREETQQVEMPDVTRVDTRIDPEKLIGNQGELKEDFERQSARFKELGSLLRDTLAKNQGRTDGQDGGTGTGNLDPNTTPGRQARWIITYPTLPQSEYGRMLDSFRIEMGYLQTDRQTMQYLAGFQATGRKYSGAASAEDRMFWYWMGNNQLAQLDDEIMRSHGLNPSSEVVHLYPKEVERRLAELEKAYLSKTYRTSKIDRIQQTNFKIVPGGPSGWRFEVTGMVLK